MSHFVGRRRSKDRQGTMSWSCLPKYFPELLEQWTNMAIQSLDIDRLMRDGHEVEFQKATIDPGSGKLIIDQKVLSTAIREKDGTGYVTTAADVQYEFSTLDLSERSAKVELETVSDAH
jgi:hypothetical protein